MHENGDGGVKGPRSSQPSDHLHLAIGQSNFDKAETEREDGERGRENGRDKCRVGASCKSIAKNVSKF